jgi:cell division septation protein DedD
VLRQGGRYSVVLASFAEQGGALTMYDALRNAGYPAEISPVKQADKIAYRVRIRQLPSRGEAQALGDLLRGKFGIAEPRTSG